MIRRLSVTATQSSEKVLDGRVQHTLKQRFSHPLKEGEKVILFHNENLLGIATIESLIQVSIDEIDTKKYYKLLGLDERQWKKQKKKHGTQITKLDWILIKWGKLGFFRKGIE